ncbi:autotransporter outer membrane beta-barrel domain-containing protein [Stenotrophomonas pavanii]|uniref:autotransporter family protein n=1 Tax=Stenotrophomonas pavanii TaxID=487698 RepID=UPI002895B558|nr:autotransporter outer membrane beta-barrel domain-containing protein [Stenotrophomonas pavanii]MDT3454773.1 autotransporter outer membrane beta-barrel domain-containing protein [Stenotrophomonas pavanii]MDT3464510.1 autotransporter outer membrane beta-barrel domain-containing protein [Stenotrophomonas pavanii]
MALVPAATVAAGDLDNEHKIVGSGDPVEEWTLRNWSLLRVQGGETNAIQANNSDVLALDAIVRRSGTHQVAIDLSGDSSLQLGTSTVRGGGIRVSGSSNAHLIGSRILVTAADGLSPTESLSIGLSMGGTPASAPLPGAWAIIDSTYMRVEDTTAGNDIASGLGVRMQNGKISIINGSRIDADNVGVLMIGTRNTPDTLQLAVDGSTIASGRGAAIRVAADQPADFVINVSNGAQLHGGNGNLLQVDSRSGSATPGASHVTFNVDDARIAGNVSFDAATVDGTLDVFLRNKAQIDGRFLNVTSASIESDSTWLMTGDSNVGHLALGSTGTVALGNGSTFNKLSVDTFDGAGGTLLFNTQLGDDSSATDKLIIKGDANGQANVRVLNAGGAGAKTDKGIELIRVGGASNAQFDLQGRAVGGQYEYFLFKDATNGGWYLRSELAGTPDPCVVDPTLPECTPVDPVDPVDPIDPIDPTPVLRPEAGAYLANQFAMDQLLRHGWRDRQGGNTSAVDGVRGWARVDAAQSKLSAVEDQLDLRVDRSRLQLGADIGVFDNGQGRVGVMGTLAKSDATSRSQLTGYSARGKVNGGALGVYGNWSNDALYVDASVQRGQFRNRVQGEGLAEERYDSDIWQSSLEAGYRIGIGQIGSTALSLQPELQLVYTDANTDRHEETNGTVVRSLGDSGLSGRVGLRLQGEGRSAAGASVSPYVVANWYRDGASNGMTFDDEALKASVPRNRYELNAGARVDFRSGLSAWGGFGVMRGDHGYREATANLSMSYKW